MLPAEEVQTLIEQAIPAAEVSVEDMTGTADHYRIFVISPAFRGKTLMEQHKMVFTALGEHLTTSIHAVDVKTSTPQS